MSLTKPKFLKIKAKVRYWDDAKINGREDASGESVPFKFGEFFSPLIDLEKGVVVDWPIGTVADFHFKVCDSGSYFLLNGDGVEIGQIINDYVPSGVCHGDNGYGDYIIFSVNTDGEIVGYKNKIDQLEFFEV